MTFRKAPVAAVSVLLLLVLSFQSQAQWVQTNGLDGRSVLSFAVSGTNLSAGTRGIGVLLSTDSGTSWMAISTGLTSTSVNALAVFATNLFAGTLGGGVSIGFPSTSVVSVYVIAVSGTNLIAGTYGGVFLSTDSGTSWTPINAGLTNTSVNSLAVFGTNLFAGTYGGGVFRKPLSELTGLISSTGIPGMFELEQNFPNPFNPTTTIRYVLPTRSHVTLSVYNTLGQQVRTLANENQEAGYHDVRFDGTGLASGLYFYRLRVGDYMSTKRLLLLK